MQSTIVKIGKEVGYTLFCTSEFALLTLASLPESVPRLAVKATMDALTYQKMVNGDIQFMRKQKMKNYALFGLKRIFGNAIYEKLRSFVLKS